MNIPICLCLSDIRNRSARNLDCDLKDWPKVKYIYTSSESSYYMAFYMTVVMFAISVIINEILSTKICMILTLTFRVDPCRPLRQVGQIGWIDECMSNGWMEEHRPAEQTDGWTDRQKDRRSDPRSDRSNDRRKFVHPGGGGW